MMIPMTNFSLLRKAGFNKKMYRRLAKTLGGIKNYGPHNNSPPWLALQHEMEWQEQHFVELLNKEDDKNEN